MKLSPDLKPLIFNYPKPKKIPPNLIDSSLNKEFHPTKKRYTFKEQYANEHSPHRIGHIEYQFGTIKGRKAVKFYLEKQQIRLVYSEPADPYCVELMQQTPPRTTFPPNSVSSTIARSLRELALKWVVDHFFSHLNYMVFDEPILDGVNPDCFVLPISQAHEIVKLDTQKIKHTTGTGQTMVDVEIKNGLFVEIKAYHGTSIVGEKEVLQAFNYAAKGGKALLITSGTLGDLDTLKIFNEQENNHDHDFTTGYEPEIYQKFSKAVKKKFRQMIRKIDLRVSQDSYDTRGIYISVASKLGKIYKYTSTWPKKVTYKLLKSPRAIIDFIKVGEGLGIVEPSAFEDLLTSQKLSQAAGLFKRICDTYLEEIIVNPPLLYPQENNTPNAS
jgi:hypothetical protein